MPWLQRRDLAYKIGSVFGQRPQLWYHLPALDTFYLFGKIYELDEKTIRQRIGLLTEAFEIQDLLETPVRKLSLGQRMRCEVAASLLHKPRLILLDEPSIGLDVVAKQRIRDTIRRMNEVENVGVLLTSHDAGDIKALCKRVIIVNHGQIIYQDKGVGAQTQLSDLQTSGRALCARPAGRLPSSWRRTAQGGYLWRQAALRHAYHTGRGGAYPLGRRRRVSGCDDLGPIAGRGNPHDL